MLKIISSILLILTLNSCLSNAIISKADTMFSAKQMGQSMAFCFSDKLIINCLERKLFEALDKAIVSNETWQVTDFLMIEKNTPSNMTDENYGNLENLSRKQQKAEEERSLGDSLALKILEFAKTRSIKLQLPAMFSKTFERRGFSSVLDDFNGGANAVGVSGIDDSLEQLEQEEGRKKKDKDKNMAMIGGMAMLAMVAQMFLGKVILIAGAAFVMAKVALLISVLGSLKKGSVGSGGSTDHVIVTGGGSGGGGGSHSHEYSSGWQRSMPYDYNKWDTAADNEHQHNTEPVAKDIFKNNEFQRSQQQLYQQNIQMNPINY